METGLFPAGVKGCVGGNFKALPSLNKGVYGDFIWEAIPVHMEKHFWGWQVPWHNLFRSILSS